MFNVLIEVQPLLASWEYSSCKAALLIAPRPIDIYPGPWLVNTRQDKGPGSSEIWDRKIRVSGADRWTG